MNSSVTRKKFSSYPVLWIVLPFLILVNCSKKNQEPLFAKISATQTGITFENKIITDDSTNAILDPYIYNGGGTATGDLNNDGLLDVIFTGVLVESEIYLNKGDFNFENITEKTGIRTRERIHGIALVDINSDNLLDIYFSASGPIWSSSEERANLLFINNGDLTFREAAAEYGIDDTGFTTQSAFLDYDRDGDLDLFILNNSPKEFTRQEQPGVTFRGINNSDPSGFDKLYRNNGDDSFTDVSEEAGIVRKLGFGLGVAISDINGDNWPDIYVSNDTTPNDLLYINNGDGTFTNRANDWLRHSSYSGMGVDLADFTNNGWPDIFQTDMMPEEVIERRKMSGSETYSEQKTLEKQGYFPHYKFNALQMNQGVTENGDVIFSEISRLAGLSYTNWSWSTLLVDLNNDGLKDAFICNGFPIAGIDYDHLTNLFRVAQSGPPSETLPKQIQLFDELHSYDIHNYLFRNNGDLTFTNTSQEWGMNTPSFSYGASYADLDNDGWLDLVINNINDKASIYRNTNSSDEETHFITVTLEGLKPNTDGIGSKLWAWTGEQRQFKYQNPYRGFMSTMDNRIHFGLGEAAQVDSLRIQWPDGRIQVLTDIIANQTITLQQQQAQLNQKDLNRPPLNQNKIFQEISGGKNLAVMNPTTEASDYKIQPLLPYEISRQGPPLATGDVNSDGLEDLFIGGAAGIPGSLFIQQPDGNFIQTTHSQPWQADSDQDDWDALFFDANGDELPDLYVASGGYSSSPISRLLQDRLYINYGDGRFLRDEQALPEMLTSTGTVTAGDFTGDGKTDLFVGGRLTPRNYPTPTRSYLLQNEGDRFVDVTSQMAPELAGDYGMVTDAEWLDYDSDGLLDLVTAGEWMPVHFFHNEGEILQNLTQEMNLSPMRGWWYSLQAGDFNGDGFPDLAAGNLGLNHTYQTSEESKFGVVAGDFSGDRTTDIILTKQVDGVEYPIYGLAKLGRYIYTLAIKFDTYNSFANASVQQAVGNDAMERALHYHTDTFASVWMENNGQGEFTVHQFPNLAQISPIMDMISTDVDGDGNLDLVLAGNIYATEPTVPQADAGNGLWLRGNGQGEFTPVSPLQSGFLATKDVRNLAMISILQRNYLIVANNNDSLQVYFINQNQRK